MNTAVARQTRVPALASAAFGLALGAATFLLHGHNPVLDALTNSTSTWIIWAAIAGALISDRGQAAMSGALMMIATCAAYYATAATRGWFGLGAIPTAAVWFVTGAIGGPILAWAGWSARRATGFHRNLAVAVIGMAVTGEGLWLAVVLNYKAPATAFLTAGVLITIALTLYRYRQVGRHPWQPLIYMPPLAGAYLAAEYFVLDRLLAHV
ncbi:MAG TPA: DUF6518 family protein [Pseudonocardiaceae bacterium]